MITFRGKQVIHLCLKHNLFFNCIVWPMKPWSHKLKINVNPVRPKRVLKILAFVIRVSKGGGYLYNVVQIIHLHAFFHSWN